MIFSDIDLRYILASSTLAEHAPSPAAYQAGHGALVITPPIDEETQIQPSSIDLRIGGKVTRFPPNFGVVHADQGIHPTEVVNDDRTEAGYITVRPGEFLLAHTLERVAISPALTARVEGRSSIGRIGLLVHATAGYIDPGFDGQITLEIKNISERTIRIPVGLRVCQIVIQSMTSPAQRPYGHPELGSRYQGQTGANPYTAPEDPPRRGNPFKGLEVFEEIAER